MSHKRAWLCLTYTRYQRPRRSLWMVWSWLVQVHQSTLPSPRKSQHTCKRLFQRCQVSTPKIRISQNSVHKWVGTCWRRVHYLRSCILCWFRRLRTWQCCMSPSWYSLLGLSSCHALCTSEGSLWSELRTAYIKMAMANKEGLATTTRN